MSKHTPGPWHFVPWHIEEGQPAVRCAEGWIVATTSNDADAEFIARAPAMEARIAGLEAELERVKRAAINGMNAATAHGHGLVEQAARLRAESNPDALESERAMNAALTEQLERAELARQDALAELAAALVDAERYRWLRAAHPNTAAIYWNIGHDWIGLRFEQLDTAIDEGRGEA